MCVHRRVCKCLWRLAVGVSCLTLITPFSLLRQGLSLNPARWASLADHLGLAILPASRALGLQVSATPASFYRRSRDSNSGPTLAWRVQYPRRLLPNSGAGVLRATVWQALSWVWDLSASACLGCLRSRVGINGRKEALGCVSF